MRRKEPELRLLLREGRDAFQRVRGFMVTVQATHAPPWAIRVLFLPQADRPGFQFLIVHFMI